MSGRATSYIGDGSPSQSPSFVRGVAIVGVALALGGCAGMGLPFGEAGANRTAQARDPAKPILASATVIDRVDPSDWETVRRTVAGAPGTPTYDLGWFNPDTGSSGAVAVAGITDQNGSVCRPFATTINDERGVRRYRGDACLRTDGRWQLNSVTADDALLS